MTWVKICGITNLEDALVAVEAGADALGFVFYEKSPRNVAPEIVRDIVLKLPDTTEKVGVMVSDSEKDIPQIVHLARLTALQYQMTVQKTDGSRARGAYGRELFPARFQTFISLPTAMFLDNEDAIRGMAGSFAHLRERAPGQPNPPAGFFETFFLDAGTASQPGGTGIPFDWNKAVPIAEGMREGGLKLVVAGGLTAKNVAQAISILHPWGVDVSSGVEERPGKKDHDKVRAFIKAVREADKASSN